MRAPAIHARGPIRRSRASAAPGTDAEGRYGFDTIKPGPVPGLDGKTQAPHVLLAVFARGMLRQSYTRIYFADETANADDAIFKFLRRPNGARRSSPPSRSGTDARSTRSTFTCRAMRSGSFEI